MLTCDINNRTLPAQHHTADRKGKQLADKPVENISAKEKKIREKADIFRKHLKRTNICKVILVSCKKKINKLDKLDGNIGFMARDGSSNQPSKHCTQMCLKKKQNSRMNV